MREPDFRLLKETLLRGGVAPRHVRRTIAELRDHHTDLFGEALSKGYSFEDAEAEASMRLGEKEELAAVVLARPELKTWTHRWPQLAYCATPPLALFVAFGALMLVCGVPDVIHVDQRTFIERWGSPDAPWSVSGLITRYVTVGLPLLVAGTTCFVAAQRRVPLKWPVIGVIVAALVGAIVQFNVVWPFGAMADGAIALRISVPPFPGSGGSILRALTTCALTLGPLTWWKHRMTRTLNAETEAKTSAIV